MGAQRRQRGKPQHTGPHLRFSGRALALAAAAIAALPGLWTLGLGKALRRLNRMEELL